MRMGAYTTNPTSTEDGEFVFGHDYMSRRVSKQVPSWDAALNDGEGDWHPTLVLDQRYVYDGWNVVLVLDGLDDNAVVRKYSWGLDLSGWSGDASPSGIHGAGGIGGLLAAVETSGTHAGSYWYLYDANGNVGQVLNATDPQSITQAAHYEYDPYGDTVAQSGTYADYNPWRFSTKWLDDESGLYYYGYRYYSPGLGRWISRDPIEEKGGVNLYVFVRNSATERTDSWGLLDCGKGCFFVEDGCVCPGDSDPIKPVPRTPRSPLCPPGCYFFQDGCVCPPLPTNTSLPVVDCLCCLYENRYSLQAEANKLHLDWLNRGGSKDPCVVDAMQHCIGGALAAQQCGGQACGQAASFFVEIWQVDGDWMDIHNGDMGAKCPPGADPIWYCEQLLENGMLWLVGKCE